MEMSEFKAMQELFQAGWAANEEKRPFNFFPVSTGVADMQIERVASLENDAEDDRVLAYVSVETTLPAPADAIDQSFIQTCIGCRSIEGMHIEKEPDGNMSMLTCIFECELQLGRVARDITEQVVEPFSECVTLLMGRDAGMKMLFSLDPNLDYEQ